MGRGAERRGGAGQGAAPFCSPFQNRTSGVVWWAFSLREVWAASVRSPAVTPAERPATWVRCGLCPATRAPAPFPLQAPFRLSPNLLLFLGLQVPIHLRPLPSPSSRNSGLLPELQALFPPLLGTTVLCLMRVLDRSRGFRSSVTSLAPVLSQVLQGTVELLSPPPGPSPL